MLHRCRHKQLFRGVLSKRKSSKLQHLCDLHAWLWTFSRPLKTKVAFSCSSLASLFRNTHTRARASALTHRRHTARDKSDEVCMCTWTCMTRRARHRSMCPGVCLTNAMFSRINGASLPGSAPPKKVVVGYLLFTKTTTIALYMRETAHVTAHTRLQSLSCFKRDKVNNVRLLWDIFSDESKADVLTGEAARRLMTTHVMITFHLN